MWLALLPFAVLSNFAVGLLPAISLSDDSTHDVSSLMLYQKLTAHGYARRVIAMRSLAMPCGGCSSKAMARDLQAKRDRYTRQRLQKLRQVVPVLPAEVLDHCNFRRLSFVQSGDAVDHASSPWIVPMRTQWTLMHHLPRLFRAFCAARLLTALDADT